MTTKSNKKAVDPAYFERVGITEFLVPLLRQEPAALAWLRAKGFDANLLDESPASVAALVALFAADDVPTSLETLLNELDSVSHPSAFEELLVELRSWGYDPPVASQTEHNLPLWARVNARDVLAGVVSHAHDTKPRRQVEFSLARPMHIPLDAIARAVPVLRDELRAMFSAKGRSALCEIAQYASKDEVELYIYHGTTRRLRTVVDDYHVETGAQNPTERVDQREQAMMVARVCLNTGRIRISARTAPDLQLLREVFGAALHNNRTAYDVPSRIPLASLLERSALDVPAMLASARVVEVTLHGAGESSLKLSAKHRDILKAVHGGELPLPEGAPVSAKFMLRPAGGGRERALEVFSPNSVRASRLLDDATVEEFLALNGLLVPIADAEFSG